MAEVVARAPRIDMVPNADFSFPRRSPPTSFSRQPAADDPRRPSSMHINLPPPPNIANVHRRAASTVPSFSFNAADMSGLTEASAAPTTPEEDALEENSLATPSRRGHRRGGSEFVGGDSRLGVTNAVSSSPTKATAPVAPSMAPPPSTGRRGHAHRRSAAISNHDIGSLMHPPTEVQPRLSSSLPTTPLEYPSTATSDNRMDSTAGKDDETETSDPFGPLLADAPVRPPSRPRVGFSDNVEIIPRPLSTISSETESSVSTVRGHSVNNSISSMLSMGTPSPPSSRTPRTSLGATLEDDPQPRARSSIEISKRVEKEGEWLKGRSTANVEQPTSESSTASPRTTFALPDVPVRSRDSHNKRHSLSHALGFDRRRSEPTIGMNASEPSRLSAISLQETVSSDQSGATSQEQDPGSYKSSTRRIKDWAASKMSWRIKDSPKTLATSSSTSSFRPESAGTASVQSRSGSDAPVAETDLDAVFSQQEAVEGEQRPATSQLRVDVTRPMPSGVQVEDFGPLSPMLDLDAALGPFKTPHTGPHRQIRELHSSRHDHRRAESAPALTPFEDARSGAQAHPDMADVFEEDEEEDLEDVPAPRSASIRSKQDEESGMGVQIVDLDTFGSPVKSTFDDGLGIRGEWEPERPTTGYGNNGSMLSNTGAERGPSVIEETIAEEPSQLEDIEIVEAHEEPRASSITKSSDSSETPTILIPPPSVLAMADGQRSLTPDTASRQNSAFSSPDVRQASFDDSRNGTSASSITGSRTVSSCMTDHGQELRPSVDDVPSLTSSRSSVLHGASLRRDFVSNEPSAIRRPVDPEVVAERRQKRGSIQSLSQLVGGSFGSRSKGLDESRPQTATESAAAKTPKKKDHRLKKLMFWKSKQHSGQTLRPS